MKNFNLFFLLSLLFILNSCSEDDTHSITEIVKSEKIYLDKIDLVDGRLYFPKLLCVNP